MIGLVGTSSTGKTTLAKAVSNETGIPFISSQTRTAYAVCGISPEIQSTHAQRMKAQHLILDMAEQDYGIAGGLFITDRTPMDFAAHVIAEASVANLSEEETVEVMNYVARCYRMTNLYFSSLILLQPAIAVIAEAGRTTNPAYVEHINLIMTGLIADPNNKLYCAKHFLKRSIVDLKKRVEVVLKIAIIVENNNCKQSEMSVNH